MANVAPRAPAVPIDVAALRSGDLIFRRGTSADSRLVMILDPGSPYSHVGLIDRMEGEVRVIHILPGNAADRENVVRREPLTDFLAAGAATRATVFRVEPAYRDHAAAAVGAAREYLARRTTFDEDFDSGSDERLYCTELVWRAYLDTGLDLIDGRLERLSFPLARGSYVLPSTLLRSPYLTEIDVTAVGADEAAAGVRSWFDPSAPG